MNQSYSVEQKVAAAEGLDDLGVDFVQIGFPIADDGTAAACAELDISAKSTGIARALERDIDAAADAGVDVIEVSAPTSDVQRSKLLDVSRDELLHTIQTALDHARDTGAEVHFGAMDGFRTDPAFIDELLSAVDAEFFGIADTVGVRTPDEVAEFLAQIDRDLSTVSVHFHDDLGVATANALVAKQHGVGKVDVSLGGIGERVGNVPLEELVVAAALGDGGGLEQIDEANLVPKVKRVLAQLDEDVPPEKPVLGETAYRHESGMHTASMLDEPSTFEPFDPARFGGTRQLRFGPASGTGAARRLLERANVEPTRDRVDEFLDVLHGLNEHVALDEAVELATEEFPG